MKYRKAWKLCSNCERSYVTVEYSLMCPECRKEECNLTGVSVATARNYEKQIWNDPDSRKDFEWTLIGIYDDITKTFQVEYVYECWSDGLKELIAAEQSVEPTVLESGQIEDHNFVDGICTFCGKAQPHSG